MVTTQDQDTLRTRSTLELVEQRDPHEINGVTLSTVAMQDLREAGISLLGLTSGELQAANVAAAGGPLIADPNGTSFLDKISRTVGEDKTVDDDDSDDDDIPDSVDDDLPDKLRRKPEKFVEMLQRQREKLLQKQAEQTPPSGCEMFSDH